MNKRLGSGAACALFGLFIALLIAGQQYINGSFEVKKTLMTALVTGVAAAAVFALYIRSFTKRQAKEFASVKERLEKKGTVYLDAAANHLFNEEYVSGWMFLTDKGLYFLANPMNVLSHSVKLEYAEIGEIRLMKQLGFINGIVAETERGSERFSVSKPKQWLKEIEERMKEA